MADKTLAEQITEASNLMREKSGVIDSVAKSHEDLKTELTKSIEDNSALTKEAIEKANKVAEQAEIQKEQLDKAYALLNGLSKLQSDVSEKTEQMTVVEKAHHDNLLKHLMGDLRKEELRKDEEAYMKEKQISVDSNNDGGILVPHSFASSIISFMREISPMAQEAKVVANGMLDAVEAVNVGGTNFQLVGEQGQRGITDNSDLREVKAVLHEGAAMPVSTYRALKYMSVNVESWLQSEVSAAFAQGWGGQWVNGNGAEGPLGFATKSLITSGWNLAENFGSYEGMTSGTNGQLGADNDTKIENLIDLQEMLKEGFQANAKWYGSRSVRTDLRKMLDADGRPLWEPSLQVGTPSAFMSAAYRIMYEMDGIGTTGAKALYFGDMAQAYLIALGDGIYTIRDDVTVKGKTLFYTTMFAGGAPLNTDALKGLELSA